MSANDAFMWSATILLWCIFGPLAVLIMAGVWQVLYDMARERLRKPPPAPAPRPTATIHAIPTHPKESA